MENIGFEFNHYDPCVTNRINVGKQHTVLFHVDNVMSSHVKHKVDDRFKEWVSLNYLKHGEVNYNIVKVCEYLVMTFILHKRQK